MSLRSLGLIMKVTRLCNLRCTYCHDWRAGPGNTMSEEVLAATIDAAARTKAAHIVFMWHGGEPTLMPVRYFQRALELQRDRIPERVAVVNKLQTNAVHVSDEWIEFLQSSAISVGVSIDASAEVHDATRPMVNGRGSFSYVQAGIRSLQGAGLSFGVEVVISRSVMERGVEAFVTAFAELGVGYVTTIPCKRPNGSNRSAPLESSPYISAAEYSSFLIDLDTWLSSHEASMRVSDLVFLRRRVAGQSAGACIFSGDCFGRYFSVEPDGKVAHCDLFVGDDHYFVGNVADQIFSFARDNPKIVDLKEEDARAAALFGACANHDICNGWCPHERYLEAEAPRECCGLSALIDHLKSANA